jgi:ribonuclease HII
MTEKIFEKYGIGIDEVGRGAIAGPVVAVAVLISSDEKQVTSLGINDSKLLTTKQRELVNQRLLDMSTVGLLKYGVGVVEPDKIDNDGIIASTNEAMRLALNHLDFKDKMILVDGIINPFKDQELKVQTIIKGDCKCYNIGAASIIAKVFRDKLMDQLSKEDLTWYNWKRNKGYGTAEHIKAIGLYGLSQHHRKSFCKNFIYV